MTDGTHGFELGDVVFIGPHGLKLWRIEEWDSGPTAWGTSAFLVAVDGGGGRRTWHAFTGQLVRAKIGTDMGTELR